jgi:hypothetical protein
MAVFFTLFGIAFIAGVIVLVLLLVAGHIHPD